MIIKDISNFFSSSIGKKKCIILLLLSGACVFVESSLIILPFFIEKFVDNIQQNIFIPFYLYIPIIFYVGSFVLTNFICFVYGKKQLYIKNTLQIYLINNILQQNPLYIKSRGEGFFSKLLEQSIETLMEIFTPDNLRSFFLIVQNFFIIGCLYYKNIYLYAPYYFYYILSHTY